MKQIILSLSLLFVIGAASGQVYVRANVGYNLPLNGALMGADYTDVYITEVGYTEKYKAVYGSYGAGLSIQAAVGGSLSKGIFGYDVEVGYLMGKKYKYTERYDYTDVDGTTDTKKWASSLQIAPSLTLTTGEGKFQPFARVGPVIALSAMKETVNITNDYNGQLYTENTEYKYKGGMGFGFKGVFGVSYSVAPKTHLYAELNFISLSYAPHKRETTKRVVNGTDELADVEKVVELKKDYETTTDGTTPPVRESYSFGSAGLQFGVKFFLK